MKKKNNLFNPVFKSIKTMVRISPDEAKKISVSGTAIKEKQEDGDVIFKDAMAGVMPLPEKDKHVQKNVINVKPPHPANERELEALSRLRGLVKGSIEMDITFSDEYIEGSISGINRKIMKRLKRGQIPVQGHLDLHGLNKIEAEEEVREFLVESHKFGRRCVLIVHGRGLNSPDSLPVLKDRLPTWLNRGPAKKIVMAFSTAMPYDGGTGAIYVLLRGR
jgi:DNA-nicking Smr family endonuclease